MVTRSVLPWLLTALSVTACGGSTDIGQGGNGRSGLNGDDSGGTGGGSSCSPKDIKCLDGAGDVGGSSTDGGGDLGGSGGGSAGGSESSGGGFGPGGTGQYPGHGFVVHEWGTDTIVVGSDGSLQRGLHHEEEDLPAFVYDRLKAGASIGAGNPASPSVTIKMETPVAYFYSDKPLSIRAKVSFPKGVLTQWYPGVASFSPAIAAPGAAGGGEPLAWADPALDPSFVFATEACRARWEAVAGGELNWGDISVLPRGTDVTSMLPAAPLSKFTWDYARAVDANPVVLPNGEAERFLFYRGLGDFELPVEVTQGKGSLILANKLQAAIGSVFAINVDANSGAFQAFPEGIAAGSSLVTSAPSLYGAEPLDQYQDKLGDAVTGALDATGLYHDEAVAMVNTWKRQWFRTPGTRLLYVIPQLWTDSSIPLTIEPKPDAVLRVMLIRVEVITPEQEAADVAGLKVLETTPAAGEAYFQALGRFAEPRLRRALDLYYSKAGLVYLGAIQGANTSIASGE